MKEASRCRIEAAFDVRFDNIPITPVLEIEGQVSDRLLRTTIGPVASAELQKVLLLDGVEHFGTGQLYEFVLQRGNAQRPFFPIVLRYVTASYELGMIALRFQSPDPVLKILLQVFLVLRRCDAVYSTGRVLMQIVPALP